MTDPVHVPLYRRFRQLADTLPSDPWQTPRCWRAVRATGIDEDVVLAVVFPASMLRIPSCIRLACIRELDR